MNVIKFFASLLILIIGASSYGQDYQNISIEDGLPSNHVYRITQDKQGFIWFITDKGMAKYDGATMKLFTTKEGLPVNDIWNIRVTPDSKVWYFSKSRKLGYILNDEVFSFPSENENEMLIPNLIFQSGNEIAFDKGGIVKLEVGQWRHTTNGSKNDARIINFLGNKTASYIEVQKSGVATIYDNQDRPSWSFNWEESRDSPTYLHGQIDAQNYLCISPSSVNFINVIKRKKKIVLLKDVFGRESSRYTRVNNVLGNLQITNEYGVANLTPALEVSSMVPVPERLGSHFSFQDRDGNLWVATFNNGVYFLPKTAEVATLFSNKKVKDILNKGNNLYCTVQEKGLYNVDKKTNKATLIIPTEDYLYGVFANKNSSRYYLSTRSEIFIWKDTDEIKDIKPKNHFGLNVRGRQLVITDAFGYGNSGLKINRLDLKELDIVDSISFPGVTVLIDMPDDLLVGTNSGLYLLNKELDQDSRRILLDVPIISIEPLDDGTTLIGSDGSGAYVLLDEKPSRLLGGSDLSIEDIAQDKNGFLYLATNEGIIVFNKKSGIYTITRKILKEDGLRSNKVNCLTIVDNYLYAGSDNGLAVVNLDLLDTQKSTHDIFLESITVGEKQFKSDTIVSEFTNDYALLATFGILDFNGQKETQRAYQLLPTSKVWNQIETNQINLGNLKPDIYTLTFKTTDHRGASSEKQIVLEITPRWYQTGLFKILAITSLFLLFTVVIYTTIRLNQNRQTVKLIEEKKIAQIELKALRSQMNPHFVFNSLSAIQYYINNNENEISEKYLVKFSKLIRKFFQLSGENEIVLSEEVALLKSYLEIEQLRFKDQLSYTIEVDARIDVNQFSIPTMLLQPIVENAVNHGIFNKEDSGSVKVTFSKLGNQEIVIIIEDDGVGYVNTRKRSNKKKSSNVTAERLHFLNQSDIWNITHTVTEAYPGNINPGARISFTIKRVK